MSIRNRKTIWIIILVILVVLTAGVVYYFYSSEDTQRRTAPTQQQEQQKMEPSEQEPQVETTTREETQQQTEEPEETVEMNPETRVKQVAKVFVERFATYSSQNENVHIESVLPLLTKEMAEWTKDQTISQDTEYQGQTTRVISTSVSSISSDQATVQIQAQQTKQKNGKITTDQNTGRVELKKVNDQWKVNGFYWD